MKTSILYTLLFCAASAGFVGWRVYAVRTHGTPHFAIVEDPSMSHVEDCEALVALAEQALHADTSPNSTVTILILGDESTANEPWRLGKYPIPTTRRALEGRKAIVRRQQDLLHDVSSKCQSIRRTTISPIFLGVKRALADLRAQGCDDTSPCRLLVDSDLEENVETSIQKNLDGTGGRKRVLPSPLDNNGIAVTFCGFIARTGHIVDRSGREIRKALPRDSGRDDQLRQVWLSLFTNPQIVKFEPYCPSR